VENGYMAIALGWFF